VCRFFTKLGVYREDANNGGEEQHRRRRVQGIGLILRIHVQGGHGEVSTGAGLVWWRRGRVIGAVVVACAVVGTVVVVGGGGAIGRSIVAGIIVGREEIVVFIENGRSCF
jgi:hypothetical protein